MVHALVGEAFTRLDPLAQEVMQALAVYTVPVPSVAVDYLLQPYRAAVDAAPVLTRLVNMQFVRRDAGRYYLHQVDRDYALHRVPLGGPTDRDADPPPFTRYALQHRGADYFAQTRTPRETWKTLDHLVPQLAEFELRYQNQDYHTAADVLHGIYFDYLALWGHYRLSIDMYQRLHGHLTDPWITSAHLADLGSCYVTLGQIPQAIDHYQQGLTIARDISYRGNEAHLRCKLGDDFSDQGAWRASVEQYLQAIQIADEIGYAQVQYEARVSLAQAHLLSGDLDACRAAAESATAHDHPPRRAQVHLLLGIAQLRQGAHLQAQQSFTAAVGHADAQLQQTPNDYFTLECKALALCGLTLTDHPDQLPEAIALFRTARAITTAPGIVTRTLRLLDAITAHDATGRLATTRAAAQGDPG